MQCVAGDHGCGCFCLVIAWAGGMWGLMQPSYAPADCALLHEVADHRKLCFAVLGALLLCMLCTEPELLAGQTCMVGQGHTSAAPLCMAHAA